MLVRQVHDLGISNCFQVGHGLLECDFVQHRAERPDHVVVLLVGAQHRCGAQAVAVVRVDKLVHQRLTGR